MKQLRLGLIQQEQLDMAAELGHGSALSLSKSELNPAVHREVMEKGLILVAERPSIYLAYHCVQRAIPLIQQQFSISPGPKEALIWVEDWLKHQPIEKEQARLFITTSSQNSQILTAQAQAFSWLRNNVILGKSLQRAALATQGVSHVLAAVCGALGFEDHPKESIPERVLEAIESSQSAIDSIAERQWQKNTLARILLKLDHCEVGDPLPRSNCE